MSVFVALLLPPAAAEHLRRAVAATRSAPGLASVSATRWHVTVAFAGALPGAAQALPEVLAGALDRLREGTASAAATAVSPATVAIRSAGAFPSAARARVLWAGLRLDPAFAALVAEVRSVAAEAGLLADADRPWRPHLTLARARRAPVDVREAVAALASYDGPRWPVTALHVLRTPPAGAPSYEVLFTARCAETALPPPRDAGK